MADGVVLLGHGTQDPEGRAELLEYVAELRRRTGASLTAGVLEYPSPELPDVQAAFDAAADEQPSGLITLPALLHFAGHAKQDVPGQVAKARARLAWLPITLAGPLGSDARLLDVLEERLGPFEPDEDTAVLVVGRGSTDPEANGDLHKLARLLWERNRFGWIEPAFVSLAPPGVEAGIQRCFRLGAKRVVVVPYFLCTGVLVKRIGEQALQTGGPVAVAPHLGFHSSIADLFVERVQQARAGICACVAAHGCRMPSGCAHGAPCPA